MSPATNEANAARIVACVNALAGKDPAIVKEMVEYLRDADTDGCTGNTEVSRCNDSSPCYSCRARAILAKLEAKP